MPTSAVCDRCQVEWADNELGVGCWVCGRPGRLLPTALDWQPSKDPWRSPPVEVVACRATS